MIHILVSVQVPVTKLGHIDKILRLRYDWFLFIIQVKIGILDIEHIYPSHQQWNKGHNQVNTTTYVPGVYWGGLPSGDKMTNLYFFSSQLPQHCMRWSKKDNRNNFSYSVLHLIMWFKRQFMLHCVGLVW